MTYEILMGVPEMQRLWDGLQRKNRAGTATKDERQLYKKWGKAMLLLSQDPRHPGLRTHDIGPLTKRYGMRVWQSYLENRNSRAMRMYWVYGPGKRQITVIGLEPHPEDKKKGAYDTVELSDLPPADGSGEEKADAQDDQGQA